MTSLSAPKVLSFASDMIGFDTQSFFYDNGEEVVVFDTQFTPELAKKALAYLRTQTQNPITHVVITHPNPDKFNGMSVFQAEGAKVVASRATADAMEGVHAYKKHFFVNMAKMFAEEDYPTLSRPDVIFGNSLDLRLGNGETIELLELASPGVSSNQTVAFIPTVNALVVGDLVHHKAHAWLEGGIVGGAAKPEIKGWIAGLKEIEKSFAKKNPRILGGRGEEASLAVAIPAQIDYLKRADRIVGDYVKSLGAKKSELSGDKAGQHHTRLQREFEAAFPDYSLGYMIQYGVYGLVNSKL